MFSQNFQKSFTGKWNWKMKPGNDSIGRVLSVGYPGTRNPGTALTLTDLIMKRCKVDDGSKIL